MGAMCRCGAYILYGRTILLLLLLLLYNIIPTTLQRDIIYYIFISFDTK